MGAGSNTGWKWEKKWVEGQLHFASSLNTPVCCHSFNHPLLLCLLCFVTEIIAQQQALQQAVNTAGTSTGRGAPPAVFTTTQKAMEVKVTEDEVVPPTQLSSESDETPQPTSLVEERDVVDLSSTPTSDADPPTDQTPEASSSQSSDEAGRTSTLTADIHETSTQQPSMELHAYPTRLSDLPLLIAAPSVCCVRAAAPLKPTPPRSVQTRTAAKAAMQGENAKDKEETEVAQTDRQGKGGKGKEKRK